MTGRSYAVDAPRMTRRADLQKEYEAALVRHGYRPDTAQQHAVARLQGIEDLVFGQGQVGAGAIFAALRVEQADHHLPSLADGLTGAVETDSITIPLVKQLVDDILLVSEQDIARAVAFAFVEYGETIEPSGAVAIAAALIWLTRVWFQLFKPLVENGESSISSQMARCTSP